jgi:hypothetical protein
MIKDFAALGIHGRKMRYRPVPFSRCDAGLEKVVETSSGGRPVDRRSFIMTLIGGVAAASLGGAAVAEAAQPKPAPMPEPAAGGDQLAADTVDALDKTEAEFSQYYYYRRRPRYYRRPVVVYRRRPRYYARPRYVVRRRRYYY